MSLSVDKKPRVSIIMVLLVSLLFGVTCFVSLYCYHKNKESSQITEAPSLIGDDRTMSDSHRWNAPTPLGVIPSFNSPDKDFVFKEQKVEDVSD